MCDCRYFNSLQRLRPARRRTAPLPDAVGFMDIQNDDSSKIETFFDFFLWI